MSFKPDCDCWEEYDENITYQKSVFPISLDDRKIGHYAVWVPTRSTCQFCGKPAMEVDGE